ncbi:MAG: hypothetical protein Ct9H300mP16_18270 [Pseudomonadota bacterium]|nr:MAG: hypothetical protein Ct9H300mP16_18270 [Pseudomonadota bacterium]
MGTANPRLWDAIGKGARWLLDHLPYYVEWFRFTMFWRYGDGPLPFLRKDPDWLYPERALNRVNDRHRQEMTDFIHSEFRDRPDLAVRCLPDYPAYGKRILLDNGWYRTLARPHIELVTDPIARITADGVRTAMPGTESRYSHLCDRLSDDFHGFKFGEISGRNGLDLRTAWQDDNPTAYLGITVPGFPIFSVCWPEHRTRAWWEHDVPVGMSGTLHYGLHRQHGRVGALFNDVPQDAHDDYVRALIRNTIR